MPLRLATSRSRKGMAARVAHSLIISVIGAYGGFVDKFPIGAVMNRSLTIRSGQCHVQRYMRPLLERIQNREIDPRFVITHEMSLDDAPKGYKIFNDKLDDCEKIVLKPH